MKKNKSTCLEQFLFSLRQRRTSYEQGLAMAIKYVRDHDGQVKKYKNGNISLSLNNFRATCFKPYDEIDLHPNTFYAKDEQNIKKLENSSDDDNDDDYNYEVEVIYQK